MANSKKGIPKPFLTRPKLQWTGRYGMFSDFAIRIANLKHYKGKS